MTTATSEVQRVDMRRINSIQTHRQADLERRREELRNLRWTRRRSMLITIASLLLAAALLLSGGPKVLIQALRAVAGL
jgi:hypothetical protein